MDNKGSAIKIIAITLLFLSIIGIVLIAYPYLAYNELLFALIVLLGGSICAIHTFFLYCFGSMYKHVVKIENKLNELEKKEPQIIEKEIIKEVPVIKETPTEIKPSEAILEAATNLVNDSDHMLKQARIYLSQANFEDATKCANYYLEQNKDDVNGYLIKLFADLEVKDYDELKTSKVALTTSPNYRLVLDLADEELKNDLTLLNNNLETEIDNAKKEEIYQAALNKANDDSSISLNEVIELLKPIEDYKDAKELIEAYTLKINNVDSENIYQEAMNLMKINDLASYKYAKDKLNEITNYKDASAKIEECDKCIKAIEEKELQDNLAYEAKRKKKKHRRKIFFTILLIILVIAIGLGFYGYKYLLPDYLEDQANLAYTTAVKSDDLTEQFNGLKSSAKLASDDNRRLNYNEIAKKLGIVSDIALFDDYLLTTKDDGHLAYTTYTEDNDPFYQNLKAINNSIAISVNNGNLISLKNDGSVQVINYDINFANLVKDWKNIMDVKMGEDFALGLTTEGKLVLAGASHKTFENLNTFENIVAIAAGDSHILALNSEGKVLAAGANSFNQTFTSSWENVVAIAAGNLHSVALMADGTVKATGNNHKGQIATDSWTDIIQIAAGENYTLGLKADGSVVATGDNEFGQCDVSTWKNVSKIYAGINETIGITKDGKILTTNPERFAPKPLIPAIKPEDNNNQPTDLETKPETNEEVKPNNN